MIKMNNYDVLYGVIIRLQDPDGIQLSKNIDNITERLGNAIKKEFPDMMAIPFGFGLVEPDGKVRILNKIEYNEEFPEDDEEEV